MVQVKVQEGMLEGTEVDNDYGGKFYSFKGVPYAQPPLGDLRFKAPQLPKPWQGVRSAKEHGPKCFQFDSMISHQTVGSEDCLYLNVYTPNMKPNKPLPVMFWIHGGAFVSGDGNDDIYGPEFLIRHDVILVTINYRLEVLGFLCLDSEDVPGNAGFKDQVAALRWVKKNISYFGGDPENITIFGESAGAGSVSLHLISPMTKGLFKKAIAQSGSANNPWTMSIEPRERAKALARKLGLDSDDNKELYEFFKSQPAESLVQASVPITLTEVSIERRDLHYGAVNEKLFGNNERYFYGDVYDALRKGIHEGVEVITGYCRDEGLIAFPKDVNINNYLAQLNAYPELFTPKEIELTCPLDIKLEVGRKMKKFYFGDKKVSKETMEQVFQYHSAMMFNYGIIQWLKITCAKNKVYLYKFTCHSERNWVGYVLGHGEYIGNKPIVCHGDDMAYLFSMKLLNQKIEKSSETFKLINNVTTFWTNFAKFGNPTPDSSLGVNWSPYTLQHQDCLEIGNQLKSSSKPDDEEMEFWESIYKQYLPHYVASGCDYRKSFNAKK